MIVDFFNTIYFINCLKKGIKCLENRLLFFSFNIHVLGIDSIIELLQGLHDSP